MRAACDAEFYQTAEGQIAIRGEAWAAPTVTIREDDILGHSMELGNNRFTAFNEVKILYTSPLHDYQTMEATPWENLGDQAERDARHGTHARRDGWPKFTSPSLTRSGRAPLSRTCRR